jgi:hypothetical protein
MTMTISMQQSNDYDDDNDNERERWTTKSEKRTTINPGIGQRTEDSKDEMDVGYMMTMMMKTQQSTKV